MEAEAVAVAAKEAELKRLEEEAQAEADAEKKKALEAEQAKIAQEKQAAEEALKAKERAVADCEAVAHELEESYAKAAEYDQAQLDLAHQGTPYSHMIPIYRKNVWRIRLRKLLSYLL